MKDYVTELQAQPVCDFCSKPNPTWRYPCLDFDMAEIVRWGSKGDFAACDECSWLSSSTTNGVTWRVVLPTSELWKLAHSVMRYTWLSA